MFARVRTLVTLEAMSGQLFRWSGSTRSCLSRFLMSMSLLYVNFRRNRTGFKFRVTKDGTQHAVPIDVTLLLETRQIYKEMHTCWRTQVKSPEAPHSWIYPPYQGFRTCLKLLGIRPLNEKLTNSWPEINTNYRENMYKSRSEAWGRNESGEEETDRCGRQAIINSKCNRCWQGSDPGSEMTSGSPPDVSERGDISQQDGTKANWRHVRRKDEKLFFTTAIITHDHYSTGSVEHHLQLHQPKRSRVTSLVTQAPK